MLLARRKVRIETERLTLRPPVHSDFRPWVSLRQASAEHLVPWEPSWAPDHLSRKAFTNRVYWSQRSINAGTAVPLFLIRRSDDTLLGAITLDNIRRGPSQSGTLGYWTGEMYARQGYMEEAIKAMVHYAFTRLDLSRIEAACLPENKPSRGLLEKTGFLWASFVRLLAGVAGLIAIGVIHSDRRIILGVLVPSSVWKIALPASIVGNYMAMLAWLAGFKYTLVSVAAILNQLSTIFTFVLAAIFLKEPVTLPRMIAIVMAVCGALLAATAA